MAKTSAAVRGVGIGVGVGTGVAVGVALGSGVGVGVDVGVSVGVAVGTGVDVRVAVGRAVGGGVTVGETVAVGARARSVVGGGVGSESPHVTPMTASKPTSTKMRCRLMSLYPDTARSLRLVWRGRRAGRRHHIETPAPCQTAPPRGGRTCECLTLALCGTMGWDFPEPRGLVEK